MSNPFTEEPLEILDEWNAVLDKGCCCGMPECPQFIEVCESIELTICGFSLPVCEGDDPEDACRRFKTRTDSYTMTTVGVNVPLGGSLRRSSTQVITSETIYEMQLIEDVCTEVFISSTNTIQTSYLDEEEVYVEETDSFVWILSASWDQTEVSEVFGDGPCTGTLRIYNTAGPDAPAEIDPAEESPSPICFIEGNETYDGCNGTRDDLTYTYETEVTGLPAGVTANRTNIRVFSDELDGVTALADLGFPDDVNGTDCEAAYYCDPPYARKVQVQFQVPITHLGTYFAVMFDVVFEPDGWDDVTIFRTMYATNVLREWTGPGTGDQDDSSWLLGAVYDIPAPTTPGVHRIVNRRYWCYRGPFGYLPQITGEGVEIVTPP